MTEAHGVELEPILADSINQQAGKYGVGEKLICFCGDVFETIPRLCMQSKKYDVIMLAPPQYKGIIDKTLACLKENDVLATEGIIICQHDTSETKETDFSLYAILQQRKYGNTTFTILGKAKIN